MKESSDVNVVKFPYCFTKRPVTTNIQTGSTSTSVVSGILIRDRTDGNDNSNICPFP